MEGPWGTERAVRRHLLKAAQDLAETKTTLRVTEDKVSFQQLSHPQTYLREHLSSPFPGLYKGISHQGSNGAIVLQVRLYTQESHQTA